MSRANIQFTDIHQMDQWVYSPTRVEGREPGNGLERRSNFDQPPGNSHWKDHWEILQVPEKYNLHDSQPHNCTRFHESAETLQCKLFSPRYAQLYLVQGLMLTWFNRSGGRKDHDAYGVNLVFDQAIFTESTRYFWQLSIWAWLPTHFPFFSLTFS